MELPRKPIVLAAVRSGSSRSIEKERLKVAVFRGEETCSNITFERRIDAECAFAEAVVRAERSVHEHAHTCRVELRLGQVLLDVAHIEEPTRQ